MRETTAKRIEVLNITGKPLWWHCGECGNRVSSTARECGHCQRQLVGLERRVRHATEQPPVKKRQ